MIFCVFICIYAEFFVLLQRILCVYVHAHYEHMKNYIENAKHIVIFTHMAPDGDAMGSSLALWHYVKNSEFRIQISVVRSSCRMLFRLSSTGCRELIRYLFTRNNPRSAIR